MNLNQFRNVMKSIAFMVFLLGFVLLPVSIYATAYPVKWMPERIEQTLGFEGVADIPATFVSSIELENVDLRVVPELQHLVSVEPDHFAAIAANTEYDVMVHIAVPHGTYPGLYDGTIHLAAGKRTYPQTLKVNVEVFYEGVSIPPTTKVPDSSTTQKLLSVSADGSLTFSEITPQLSLLMPGDVIVIGVTPNTPNGLLRRVANVFTINDQVIVETVPATLEDAIEECTVHISKVLTTDDLVNSYSALQEATLQDAELFSRSFDETLYGDIKIRGNITVTASFDFDLSISEGQLEELTCISTVTETSEIEVKAEIEQSIQEEREIACWSFTPITIWVGWFPIFVTPVLTVNVGVGGEVSVGIATTVTQEAFLTAGLTYDDGNWTPVSDFSNNFSPLQVDVWANCKAEGYAKPQLDFMVYGITGPYATIKGYLELDADLFRTPWWILYGGLEVGAGVKAEVFGSSIFDYDATLISYRIVIAQAEVSETQKVVILGDYFETLNTNDAVHLGEENNPSKYLVGGSGLGSVTYTFDLPLPPNPEGDFSLYMDTLEVNFVSNVVSLNGNLLSNLQVPPNNVNLLYPYPAVTLAEQDARFYTDSFTGSNSILQTNDNNLTLTAAVSGWNTDDITITNIYLEYAAIVSTEQEIQNILASPSLSNEFALRQSYPNPFNPDTWIPYQLAEDVNVIITIYNTAGHLIRTLNLGHKPAGFYTTREKAAYWDGRNEAGEQVASGVYFYTIQAGGFTATKKMIVAR